MAPRRRKILIVDDSEVLLAWAKASLTAAGYEVITRNVPIGAAAAILRERPAVVLLDIAMPALDGTEVTRVVKAEPMLQDTVIVLYSDRPGEELKKIAASCHADGYIEKTGDARSLARELEVWVSRADARARATH